MVGKINLTQEQLDIINCDIGDIAIEALAGTAKTTTLVEYAKNYPNKKFIYLCFNKSIQEEASKRFPINTLVKTFNSIAYNYFFGECGYDNSKFVTYIRRQKLYEIFGEKGNRNNLRAAIKYMEFWFTKKIDLSLDIKDIQKFILTEKHTSIVEVKKLCDMILKERFSKTSRIGYDHDTYLKYFQINKIKFSGFDYILFDESQDSNAILTDIVYNQDIQKIFVGDNHQAIYQFRGAKNELSKFLNNCKNKFTLTQTFRFGNNLAELVSRYLHKYKGENKLLKGLDNEEVKIFKSSEYILSDEYLNTSNKINLNKVTITKIYRTNGQFFYEVNKLLKEPNHIYFTVNGDIKKYKFDICLDIYYLRENMFSKIRSEIKKYKNFNQLQQAIKNDEEDDDIASVFNFVKNHRDLDIEKFIETIEIEHQFGKNQPNKIIFTTAHVSKGLEWDNVILADDFLVHARTKAQNGRAGVLLNKRLMSLKSKYLNNNLMDEEYDIYESEINLLYVAMTRAKKMLIIPDQIYDILS